MPGIVGRQHRRLRDVETPLTRAARAGHAEGVSSSDHDRAVMLVAPKRDKSRVAISVSDSARIRHRLTGTMNGTASVNGYVCSAPWARVCLKALESGRLPVRKKLAGLEGDLHKAGVYPPGGPASRMVENGRTLRWMPPDYTGSPLDEREDLLTLLQGCKLPASCSALALHQIHLMKSRGEKVRIRTSRR
jgi:hypothetical protein